MLFECEGERYDTTELREFTTKDPCRPLIYATMDWGKVFVFVMNHWSGVQVHRAGPKEVVLLASQYRINDLLQAVEDLPAEEGQR